MSESNVPKFGSFKPKPTSPSPLKPKEEDHRIRGRARDGRKHSKRRRSKSRSRSRSRIRHRDLEAIKERAYSPKRVEAVAADIFVVDRKGDEKNLVYGSIHRYSVPPFHRIGAGSVLGSPSDTKIDRDTSNDKFIILSNTRNSNFAKREKYAFSKLGKPRLLRSRPDAITKEDSSLQSDYVPLQPPRGKKRKRYSGSPLSSSGSDNETDYRSIHGKAKPDQPLDDASECASASDSTDSNAAMKDTASARQKNVELSRKVEESPGDIEAWLALIQYQDKILQGGDERRRVTNAEMRSTADIKIHMYEKALEKVKSLTDRERLLQGIMTEGSKIWEVKYQSDKWEHISKENIDSLLLWKSYLNFKQTTFATFRYEGIRELYVKRICLLLETISATNGAEPATLLYKQLVYILLRFTLFVRESGYTELAVAIWQCVLEVNFRSPLLKSDWKNDFQEFWDSEIPRIGEINSQGWSHFAQDPDGANLADTQIDELDNFLESKALFKSWTIAEGSRRNFSRIPAKTMDEVVEDDPFRVILFSDIENFLIMLPPDAEDLRKSILDAFFMFCRLPPMDASDWYNDPFVRGELLDVDSTWIQSQYLARMPEESGNVSILSALHTSCPNFSSSPETMFSFGLWFRTLESWRDRYAGDNGPVSYTWVRNTLKQLFESYSSEEFAEYYLAFEWRNEQDVIKKMAKTLLKKHSGSLRLYNAYAMIEWSSGNKEVADRVFTAALDMSKSMSEIERIDSILLWKSCIWACLEDMDNASALKHILSISDGTPNPSIEIGPTAFIKAKQYLSSNRDYLVSSGDVKHAVIYGECLAILEYLSSKSSKEPQSSNQGDIASALSIITSFSTSLAQRSHGPTISQELFLQSAARLIFHHVRIGPFRPALLREHLQHFLAIFPHNTIFLSLYSWNESRLRIDRRVRDLLAYESLTSQMFKIKWEIENGTIHSARAAFENALSSPISRSSTSIWRFYLVFSMSTSQFRSRGKDIWYRALRACPWAKELYISGLELMIEKDTGFGELKSTWRVMGEKELRVHVDLEDRFDQLE